MGFDRIKHLLILFLFALLLFPGRYLQCQAQTHYRTGYFHPDYKHRRAFHRRLVAPPPINLNNASVSALMTLPNIGFQEAYRIVTRREEMPIDSWEALKTMGVRPTAALKRMIQLDEKPPEVVRRY